jgi:uncharacterized protein (TIGR02117 family)
MYPAGMRWALSLLLSAVMLAACAAPRPGPASPLGEEGSVFSVYLVAHGWHTGIAVRRTDIPPGLWPESGDFAQAEYIEVGWGDRDFYQQRDPGVWTALRAALRPTPSVLQLVALRGPVQDYFRGSEVIRLILPGDGFERLIRYIDDAHERGGAPRAAPLGPALYGEGAFYPGRERFHLLRTCNVWTARALRAAGLPIEDAITSSGLMSQARRIGAVVSNPAPPDGVQ